MRHNKFFIGFLLVAFFFTTNAGVFAPQPANAIFHEEAGKFFGGVVDGGGKLLGDIGKGAGDFVGGVGQVVGDVGKGIGEVVDGVGKWVAPIGDQLKAITQVKIPGTDAILDLTAGFASIQQNLLATLPDEIPVPIPGIGDFTIYTKESPATNVIKNLAPLLGGVMGALDPWRPVASLARTVIKLAKPFFDDHIKPYLPGFLKGGAHAVKEFVKSSLKAIENPILTNIIFPVWDFFVGPFDDLAMDIVDLLAEEQQLPPPFDDPRSWAPGPGEGEKMKGSVGISGDPLPYVEPIKPLDAVGSFDGIDAEGYAFGWAADPDTPEQAVGLEYLIDGAHESFEYTTKENSTAGAASPAGAAAFPGAHGFRVAIPNKWRDGKPHTVVVKAYDTATGVGVWSNIITLPGSPRTFTLSRSGMGSLDSLSDTGIVTGWAYDADTNGVAEVEIYLDGRRGAGGTLLGTVQANLPRPDLPAELLTRERIPTNAIGYTFQVNKAVIPGGRHEIFAFIKDVNSTTGEIRYIELTMARDFYIPIVHALRFAEDPYVVVQGRWVIQEVTGLPSDYHLLSAYLDGTVIDMNQQQRSLYPWMYSPNQNYKIISGPKNGSASATLQFKIPLDFPLGDHVVQLKTSDAAYHAYGSDHFTVRVVAPSGMEATSSDTITVGSDTDSILSNIPRLISLTKNATVTQVYLAATVPGYETASGYEPYRTMLQNVRVADMGNRTAKITAFVPPEASSLRTDSGPIRLYVIVKADTKVSQDEFLVGYPHEIRIRAHTNDGKDPTLLLNCSSSLTPKITMEGLRVKGEGFGCRDTLTVTISGVSLGKPFIETATNIPMYAETPAKPPPYFHTGTTQWNGTTEEYADIDLGSNWSVKYGDAEELTITVKDSHGRSASATTKLDVMRVLPAEGETVILPGHWFRVLLKAQRGGSRVAVFVDDVEVKRTYLESNRNEPSITIDVRLPDEAVPGAHVVTLKSVVDGKIDTQEGSASTRFLVSTPKVKPKEEKKQEPDFVSPDKLKSEPTPVPKPKPVLEPKVSVTPTKTKPDTRVTITMTGYNPLGTVTINLKGQGRTVKLSGYADYTDSSGDLIKEARLPDDLKGGEYTIEATDIQGLMARTSLTIDIPLPPSPLPPKPAPAPTPTPTPLPMPTPEPAPLPPSDDNKTPTCPTGSTYSPTFQQCLEDAPTKLSPYDGLPCPENYQSIPSYATKGCIP